VRILFLLSLLGVYTLVKGQSTEHNAIDSLETVLKIAKDTKQAVDILNTLSVEYYNTDLKKSLGYGQQALEKSKKIEYDRGTQQALTILMRVHRRLGNFSVAIEYTLSKISIAEQLDDTLDLIDAYSSLGNIYSSLERYDESRKYLKRAYAIGEKVNVPNLASIMNFIGRGYTKAGRYDSAAYWIEKALQREQQHPQPDYTLSYIYNNRAEVYYLEKELTNAKEFYMQSLRLPAERKSQFGLTYTLNGLARIHKDRQEFPLAIEAIVKSLAISKANGYRDKIKESYGILHEVYEAMNDYKNALHYYKLFNVYQDSIFSEDKLQYIENLKLGYETNRVARENELLRKDAELNDARMAKQRSITGASITAVFSLLILLFILFKNYRKRKETNIFLSAYSQNLERQVDDRTRELVKTNLELIRQNSQLEQFGFIIAHNLRSPVARILGLTNLIKSDQFSMPQDEIVVQKLRHSAEDLDHVIHDLNAILEIKKGATHSFEPINLMERLNKVRSILRERITESKAQITDNFNMEMRCYGIPAYFESILYNLVSNAIKYRSPARTPVITVSAKVEDDNLRLEVTDNGIGLDLSLAGEKVFNLYQRFHNHVEGKGIGLFLVKTQVEAMNGKITVESTVGEGTRFTIHIPRKAG